MEKLEKELNNIKLKLAKIYQIDEFSDEDYIQIIDSLNKALALCEVSRSIGKSTKPTLRTLSDEDYKKTGFASCTVCVHKELSSESDICLKCVNENDTNQYYG